MHRQISSPLQPDEESAMPTTKAQNRVPSRRAQHKSRTRQALREAALDLFASQGYDATTTEEISEKAGVAARTFFRYFPTKEAVLFFGEHAWIQALGADFLSQPDSMSDIEAMCASFVIAAPGLSRSRQYLLLWETAIASSPTLRGRQMDGQLDDAATVAKAIAARRGLPDPDERCRLLASVGLLTHRRALNRWLQGPAATPLGEVIAEEFALLSDLSKNR
jgi:AcrR family transcriptional regulator